MSLVSSSFFFSCVQLNPWFITGFTDGEGCFIISIINNQ